MRWLMLTPEKTSGPALEVVMAWAVPAVITHAAKAAAASAGRGLARNDFPRDRCIRSPDSRAVRPDAREDAVIATSITNRANANASRRPIHRRARLFRLSGLGPRVPRAPCSTHNDTGRTPWPAT